MESELEKFRRQKRREEYKLQAKGTFSKLWSTLTNSIARAVLPTHTDVVGGGGDRGLSSETETEYNEGNPSQHSSSSNSKSKIRRRRSKTNATEPTKVQVDPKAEKTITFMNYLQLFLQLLVWVFFYIGFLKLGFGAVFFVISGLWFVWTNTRKEGRREGEASAYSVFNPNCEALDGTLKAEDLERQLLFRN